MADPNEPRRGEERYAKPDKMAPIEAIDAKIVGLMESGPAERRCQGCGSLNVAHLVAIIALYEVRRAVTG